MVIFFWYKNCANFVRESSKNAIKYEREKKKEGSLSCIIKNIQTYFYPFFFIVVNDIYLFIAGVVIMCYVAFSFLDPGLILSLRKNEKWSYSRCDVVNNIYSIPVQIIITIVKII